MTDIYDIKTNILGFPIDLFYSFLYVIIFLVSVILLNKYFNKKHKIKDFNLPEIILTPKIDYLELLKNVEINSPKEIFYSKLSGILREFLEEKLEKSFSKMTFKEIKSLNLEKNIENLIKNIYFNEFMQKIDDNEEIREKILGEVKNFIITKN